MAELTLFSYHEMPSVFHGRDARFKVICFALISITILHAGINALLIFSLAAAVVLMILRIHPVSLFKEMRYFMVLLVFVFIVRSMVTPGRTLFEFSVISVSAPGVVDGLTVCWRLLLVVLFGMWFIITTKPSEIKSAVEWFLSPFSFIPGKRIAVMMGLTIRFLPLVLDQAHETGDAMKARGIEKRKNPVFRINRFVVPFIRRLLQRADALAIAMEARCYSEDSSGRGFLSETGDWIMLLYVIALCGGAFSL